MFAKPEQFKSLQPEDVSTRRSSERAPLSVAHGNVRGLVARAIASVEKLGQTRSSQPGDANDRPARFARLTPAAAERMHFPSENRTIGHHLEQPARTQAIQRCFEAPSTT
jgi:hypothetical protein